MKIIVFLQVFLIATVALFYPNFWLEATGVLVCFWSGYLARDVYGTDKHSIDTETEEDDY